jgi:hypothetical protein
MKVFRTVTVQGTLFGSLTSEQQAAYVRGLLPETTPVFSYRNVYYSEPEDGSHVAMAAHPAWQLKGANGKPINPAGKLV